MLKTLGGGGGGWFFGGWFFFVCATSGLRAVQGLWSVVLWFGFGFWLSVGGFGGGFFWFVLVF